jgi:hypothetical protein
MATPRVAALTVPAFSTGWTSGETFVESEQLRPLL